MSPESKGLPDPFEPKETEMPVSQEKLSTSHAQREGGALTALKPKDLNNGSTVPFFY